MDLDPGSPGEWLAAVGLSGWGRGRWERSEALRRYTPWGYVHEGDMPTGQQVADRILDALDCDVPMDSRWHHQVGNATMRRTAHDLAVAVSGLGDLADEFDPLRCARTPAGKGWMVDATWLPPPAAYCGPQGTKKPDPGRPTAAAALAVLGSLTAATWPGHWPRPSIAVGHLWAGNPADHESPGTIVAWRRLDYGAPAAGPLGAAKLYQLAPPSWPNLVLQTFEVPLQPVGLIDIAERLGVAPRTPKMWKTRGLLPSARWTVSGGPVWDWPDIEAWAARTGRLPEDHDETPTPEP